MTQTVNYDPDVIQGAKRLRRSELMGVISLFTLYYKSFVSFSSLNFLKVRPTDQPASPRKCEFVTEGKQREHWFTTNSC